jgi:hypothetical protein
MAGTYRFTEKRSFGTLCASTVEANANHSRAKRKLELRRIRFSRRWCWIAMEPITQPLCTASEPDYGTAESLLAT